MTDALFLVPTQRESEEDYFFLPPVSTAEAVFQRRRFEDGVTTPCQTMEPRHFWADEEREGRETAKRAAERVLPGLIACRTCPLLPECYRIGAEGTPSVDGVYGGEYFNVIPYTGRPSPKQAKVRQYAHKLLAEGARNDLGVSRTQARW